jgi:DNA-binding transcriptional MerR regulator
MVFGKKKEEAKETVSDVPVQAVISMRDRGLSNEQVIEQLKSQGYSLQSIRDALTQADIKKNAVGPMPELPPLPGEEFATPAEEVSEEPVIPVRAGPGLNAPMSYQTAPVKEGPKIEEMERILEEIVDERWKDVTSKFSEFESARVKNETRVDELSKRVSELSSRIDEISNVVMGKVDEYKRTMEDVDVEIKALEKVMQKLVPSMAEQVRDLKDVVGGLKGARPLSD